MPDLYGSLTKPVFEFFVEFGRMRVVMVFENE
jgi:hypothetical protein